MPRTPKPRYTITMTADTWENLLTRLGTTPWHNNAVLAGTTNDNGATVKVAIVDTDTDDQRAEQRRLANEHDMDVIGQVSVTYDTLDTTIARTKAEQEGRRQTTFSLPEGHVFLHVHNLAGRITACASVLRGRTLQKADIRITEAEGKSAKVRRPRKPRLDHEPTVTS